jgi:hypothetical protein
MAPQRPDLSTLRVLRATVEDIGENPAIQPGATLFSVTFKVVPEVNWQATEPPRRDLRDLLQLLRHLDMPSSDIRVERVVPILERTSVPEWHPGLHDALAAYREAQEPKDALVQHPDDPPVQEGEGRSPKWIRPREAWDLWAYGEVLHQEYKKELDWKRMGPHRQPVLRDMAHVYTMMLIDQAEFFTRVIRHGLLEPLDD